MRNPQMNLDLVQALTPRMTKYIPYEPTAKQQAFMLLDDVLEVFYGGAAGGGKSDALLMAALQYVDVPGYNAVIIRDKFQNLIKPEGLQSRSFEWLQDTDARWNSEKKCWIFPSSATLSFGYMDGPRDHFNFQGPAYQYVGFDEIVGIRKNQAMYMHSRMRRLKKYSHIPIRFRAASNPPSREQADIGSWVKDRYIDPLTREKRTVFIPANIDDNPHLDKEEYVLSLNNLDPITRAQLLDGDWNVQAAGGMFERHWFELVDAVPEEGRIVRFWDLAATEKKSVKDDPDYTVGVKIIYCKKMIFIADVIRTRTTSWNVKQLIKQTAHIDGRRCKIRIEQEPGQSGKSQIDDFITFLIGFDCKGRTSTGSKTEYAAPFSSQAEAGNVRLKKALWNKEYLDEAELFPYGTHDDQIDASSKGVAEFISGKRVGVF